MLLRSGCGFWRLFQPHSCERYVPVQCFIRALFASSLPPGVAYLFAGPLLVVEQLKRQLAIIHEAQRARGVPLDEGWYQRLRAMPALIIPLTHNALNDLAVRGAALDMRAFRIHDRRTTLWAPADSTLQRVARYTMILLMLTEFGAWIWLRWNSSVIARHTRRDLRRVCVSLCQTGDGRHLW